MVLFVHSSSMTQVQLSVVWEAIPGSHMERSVIFIYSAAVDCSSILKEILGTSADRINRIR